MEHLKLLVQTILHKSEHAQLDILVKFGFKNLSGDILSSATYGVWAYHFGDQRQVEENYVGYWEVIKKSSITTATLYVLDHEDRPGRILYQSSIATFMFSPARNKNSILWFASAFLVRQLETLSRFGIDYYMTETAWFNKPDKIIGNRSIKTPSTLEALKCRYFCFMEDFTGSFHQIVAKRLLVFIV